MVIFWFALAALLLAAALALLLMDRRQRSRRDGDPKRASTAGSDASAMTSENFESVAVQQESAYKREDDPASVGLPQAAAQRPAASGNDAPETDTAAANPAADGDHGPSAEITSQLAAIAGPRRQPQPLPAEPPAAGEAQHPQRAEAETNPTAAASSAAASGAGAHTAPDAHAEAATPPIVPAPPHPAVSPRSDNHSGDAEIGPEQTKVVSTIAENDAAAGLHAAGASQAEGDENAVAAAPAVPSDGPHHSAAEQGRDAAAAMGSTVDQGEVADPQSDADDNTYFAEPLDVPQHDDAAGTEPAQHKLGPLARIKGRLSSLGSRKAAGGAAAGAGLGAAAAGAAGAHARQDEQQQVEPPATETATEAEVEAASAAPASDEVPESQPHAAGFAAPAALPPDTIDPDSDAAVAQRQQWLASRGFSPIEENSEQEEYRGRFRGAETLLLFASHRMHVTVRRPGPNTTCFSLERSNAPGADDSHATVAQMTLRSAEDAADALLEDPRLVRTLRAAPPEFAGVSVEEQWAHTSVPIAAVAAYDGVISALYGVVAAAAALPARPGAAENLDLRNSDPGSAAERRSSDPVVGSWSLNPPRVVDADTDADDALLIAATEDEIPPTSTVHEGRARVEADSASESEHGVTKRGPQPEDLDLVPRKPGRSGHLRLVRPAGAAAAGAGAVARREQDGDAVADNIEAATSTKAGGADEAAPGEKPGPTVTTPATPPTRDEDAGAAPADVTADETSAVAKPEVEPEVEAETEKAEPNPFDAAMRADDVPANRGDVAADFLPARPPSPRPSRGAAASYGDGAGMPTLGEPDLTAESAEVDSFKALGASEEEPKETRESIVAEIQRFEQTRMAGAAPDKSDDAGTSDGAVTETKTPAESQHGTNAVSGAKTVAGAVPTKDEQAHRAQADEQADGSATGEQAESRAAKHPGDAENKAAENTAARGVGSGASPRRRRDPDNNPNAVTIAELLARESRTQTNTRAQVTSHSQQEDDADDNGHGDSAGTSGTSDSANNAAATENQRAAEPAAEPNPQRSAPPQEGGHHRTDASPSHDSQTGRHEAPGDPDFVETTRFRQITEADGEDG